MPSMRRLITCAVLGATLAAAPAAIGKPEQAPVVSAGALHARANADPWRLTFTGPPPQASLEELPGTGTGPSGALGFRTAAGWFRGTRVIDARHEGDAYRATLQTTDPLGRKLAVRIAPAADGVIAVDTSVQGGPTADVLATGISFVAPPGERHLGFGERSNAVDQRGREV